MIGRFETFTLALSEILSAWNVIATEELKPFGLKGPYVVYLVTLYRNPEGLTAANICEVCNKDKAEVSRAFSVMEKKGLVRKENVCTNGYRAKIHLTEEGRKITEVLHERVRVAVERGGMGLSEKEREIFYNSLETIRENLKKISREGL